MAPWSKHFFTSTFNISIHLTKLGNFILQIRTLETNGHCNLSWRYCWHCQSLCHHLHNVHVCKLSPNLFSPANFRKISSISLISPKNFTPQFEFLGAAISSSVYLAAFILVIEWLPTKYRLFAASTVTSLFAVGEMSSGLLAMLFAHYRTYLLAVYVPGLIVLAYLWLLPESVRWLHASGHYGRSLRIMRKIAKQNNRTISNKSLEILLNRSENNMDEECHSIEMQSTNIRVLFRCHDMVIRLMICACIWCLMCFIYYGIGIRATKFEGDDNKVRMRDRRW